MKVYGVNYPSFYSWEDQAYRNFMIDLLAFLEPRKEMKNVVLVDELDEFNEVLFFTTGEYEVGFEINRIVTFVLRYSCTQKDTTSLNDKEDYKRMGKVIGAYNLTFNKRSLFVYRTFKECEGFSVKRNNWKILIEDHPEISNLLKD